jgi:hypothetical protein
MIKISPLNIYSSSTNYNNIVFSFNPTTLAVNISGTIFNQYIKKSITINKKDLIVSSTKLTNSLTVLYTYLTVDLQSNTYITSITKLNSSNPYKPEFLLFLDDSLNCINDTINITNLINNNSTVYSATTNFSLISFYSLSSNNSITANISYTSIFSLTALYNSNTIFIPNNIFDIPYSRLFVSTSFPAIYDSWWYRQVFDYDSFYNINTKKMFILVSNTWQKINWQNFIKSDWLYSEGKLRINPSTSALEIQSADGIWHEIIPTIGKIFLPMSVTNYIYYVAPGQSFLYYIRTNMSSISILPVIAVNGITYNSTQSHYPLYGWTGIYPSGILINDGTCSQINKQSTTYIANNNFVPIAFSPGSFDNWKITINNNKMFILSFGETIKTQGYGTFPRNGYFLGIFGNPHYNNGIVAFTDIIILNRES